MVPGGSPINACMHILLLLAFFMSPRLCNLCSEHVSVALSHSVPTASLLLAVQPIATAYDLAKLGLRPHDYVVREAYPNAHHNVQCMLNLCGACLLP